MPDPSAIYGAPFIAKERGPLDQMSSLRNLTGTADLVNQAAKRSKKKTTPKPGNSGIDDIVALENMLGAYGGMPSADMDQLQAELRKAIAGQFNPLIQNTKQDISGAKTRAKGAKRDIGSLYDELVNYYEGQVEPTKERSAKAKQSAATNAAALKSSITDDYANRINEQVQEYKRLGIQAASGSATDSQMADQANMQAIADMTRAAEESALNIQAQGDLGYWTEGAGIANREGTEQQADITKRLMDYLNQQNQQLNVLEGQKESAYNTGLIELQQQAAQAEAQGQNQLWDRMLQLARLKLSMANSGASEDEIPNRGLSGALGLLGQQNRGDLGSTFQEYLSAAQRWATTPQGKLNYGGAVDTPEEWAQVIRDHATNQGRNPQDQNALWQAALRYFGRG